MPRPPQGRAFEQLPLIVTRMDLRRQETHMLIFDNVENHSLSACRRTLTPSGTLILNSGTGCLIKPLVVSLFVRQKLRRYVSIPNQQDLALLKELVESGELTPVLDRTYPLRETPAALSYIEGRH